MRHSICNVKDVMVIKQQISQFWNSLSLTIDWSYKTLTKQLQHEWKLYDSEKE